MNGSVALAEQESALIFSVIADQEALILYDYYSHTRQINDHQQMIVMMRMRLEEGEHLVDGKVGG